MDVITKRYLSVMLFADLRLRTVHSRLKPMQHSSVIPASTPLFQLCNVPTNCVLEGCNLLGNFGTGMCNC
jgi:hypothetical protein